MAPMKKVLILYANTGGGHLSLAKSLQKSLKDHFPNQYSITLANVLPKSYDLAYEQFGTNFKSLWGKLFYISNNDLSAKLTHSANRLLVQSKIHKQILKNKPDLIVSNNPFITSEIYHALKKAGLHSKIAIHFADPFFLHKTWLTFKNADLYLSPTKEATAIAINNAIPENKIATVGWTVRQDFLQKPPSVNLVHKRLGLNMSKFTILIGGAGQGGGKIFPTAKSFLKSKIIREKSQILVVAGNNKRLFGKLQKLANEHTGVVFPFPFVKNMAELMTASDIVVGKAGPNYLFESIFMEKPFLATGRLPGQEDLNLDFIKDERLGWVEENPRKARELVERIIRNEKLLTDKIPNLKRIKKQHLKASRKTAQAIHQLL